MLKIKSLLLAIVLTFPVLVSADEGMWLPMLLKQLNEKEMKSMGMKISAEDIYDVNNSSLKDAIVLFGRGCTGELISDEGLLITNHHCGYGRIHAHSTMEDDYLADGFWAMNKKEELSNPGLTATFLVKMEDVTKKALEGTTNEMKENKRQETILENIKKIKKEATEGTHYTAVVKPFYYGNKYYLFLNETFKDVRLVGAPPSSIGKFGGDTDNWMWPRHTGDFSLFRIYADKNNKPAEYSEDNVPYKPKKHLNISLKGVEEGDFTFVFGYPGSTQEYLPSYAIDMIQNKRNPSNIEIREKVLDIYAAGMNANERVKLMYSAKHARVANYWKKWIGENRGLMKLNAIEKKKSLEKEFSKWVNSKESRKEKYSGILDMYQELYQALAPIDLSLETYYEALRRIELIDFAGDFSKLVMTAAASNENDLPHEDIIKKYIKKTKGHFKNYHKATDKLLAKALLEMYFNKAHEDYYPDTYKIIKEEYHKDYTAYCDYLYENTIFDEEEELIEFLENFSIESMEIIQSDPVYQLSTSLSEVYRHGIVPGYMEIKYKLDSLHRIYMQGLMEMQKDKTFYPDANMTMRVTYGKVDGYEPRNAVVYNHYTTLEGIIEKGYFKDVKDYRVPEKLEELYQEKDYGPYGQDGSMPVCFTAKNHTSGGNSGSPVMNAKGELIGVNFDRNWEGTMSDLMYSPELCRNISLDIRYALFIIDKYAGAKHLINEMTIIK